MKCSNNLVEDEVHLLNFKYPGRDYVTKLIQQEYQ